MMQLKPASIGNQWKTGKTWSPGTKGGIDTRRQLMWEQKRREEKVDDNKFCERKDLSKMVQEIIIKLENKKKCNCKRGLKPLNSFTVDEKKVV